MSLCQPDKVADSHNLMVVLAHLQGVAATFRVGRHHHRGPLHEGRGLTHALTHDAPTDLTVAAALVRKASSKRRRSRLWPKPVNLRTWALVSDSIVMVQALAELRCGVVAYTRAKQCEIWAQFQPNPLIKVLGCTLGKALLVHATHIMVYASSESMPCLSKTPKFTSALALRSLLAQRGN